MGKRNMTAEIVQDTGPGLARLDGARSIVAAIDRQGWDVVRRQIGEITDDEMVLVIERCRAVGLNPLLGQVHVSVRTGKTGRKLVFTTSIHTLVARAAALPGWEGCACAAVHEHDSFRRDAVTGEVHHSHGAGARGRLLGAWAMVSYRGERRQTKWLPTEEYAPAAGGPGGSMPDLMIEKTALAMAIRLARGDLLGDVYAAEEFGGRSREDGGVDFARPADALPDPDADRIRTHLDALTLATTAQQLEAVADSARLAKQSEKWPPSAQRLYKSRLEARRSELATASPAPEVVTVPALPAGEPGEDEPGPEVRLPVFE